MQREEILRTFAKDSTISGQSCSNAKKMPRIMNLRKGEAWLTAGGRVQAYIRAASVQWHAPYLVEEAHYFRTVNGSVLREQGLRFIGVVAGMHAVYFESFIQGL